jgi:hypothetical protein
MSPSPAGSVSEHYGCLPIAAQFSEPHSADDCENLFTNSRPSRNRIPPLKAVEHIRRMRGGSQPHLLRCSDGEYYVVKFPNNPQGSRILANEFLCSRLASRLGLPVPEMRVIDVREPLIRLTGELTIELPRGNVPCKPGLCFGSRHPNPKSGTFDFLPDHQFKSVTNLADLAGALVFDLWTSNSDNRQAIFWRRDGESCYRMTLVDNGNCFVGDRWQFRDLGRLALYSQRCAYFGVTSINSFAPWLKRLETRFNEDVLLDIAREIPQEWYASDTDGLCRLVRQLETRRANVRQQLIALKRSSPERFPNWA